MDYYSVLRNEISDLLPSNFDSLLDIGCGNGATAKWIKDTYGVRVIGVELVDDAANQARTLLDQLYQINVSSELSEIEHELSSVDVILLLDILEHLVEPWDLLDSIHDLITKNVEIIVSIPNVRNFKVLLPLIFKGTWTYTNSGILDRTHLRFFTKKSMEDMFLRSGYEVIQVKPTGPIHFRSVKSKAGYVMCLLNMLAFGKLQEFISHQYIYSIRLKQEP